MIQPIQGIGSVTGVGGVTAPTAKPAVSGGFAAILDSAVKAVDATQHGADLQLEGLASGRNVDLHGTMIALEEANISLHAMTSVRDKLVEAYQTLWNMPI